MLHAVGYHTLICTYSMPVMRNHAGTVIFYTSSPINNVLKLSIKL